jgi:hypothetical protein
MKKHTFYIRIFLATLFSLFILLGIFTEFWGNAWDLLTGRGYFIPKESNMFVFKVTEMNSGSGEWWLYGEDNKYYYALNSDGADPEYYKTEKKTAPSGFNKFDYKTW